MNVLRKISKTVLILFVAFFGMLVIWLACLFDGTVHLLKTLHSSTVDLYYHLKMGLKITWIG